MSQQGADYITTKREAGINDAEIRTKLTAAGWSTAEIDAAFASLDEAPPPPSQQTPAAAPEAIGSASDSSRPIAVVEQLSTRGVEYGILFYSLAFGAISLGGVLHDLVDRSLTSTLDNPFGGSILSIQAILACITVPIFLVMLSRLRRAEADDASLHKDPSRRSFVQKTLIISFVWGVWALAYNLYQLVNITGGQTHVTASMFMTARLLHIAITLAIAGSIFVYFWRDEHQKNPVS